MSADEGQPGKGQRLAAADAGVALGPDAQDARRPRIEPGGTTRLVAEERGEGSFEGVAVGVELLGAVVDEG